MERQAFERLFAEYAGPLFGFLVYRTGDRQLAEDLVSGTFERVLKARRGFSARRGSEKAWLYTIALNLLRDHERRQGRERRILATVAAQATEEGPADPYEALSGRSDLREAFALLSPVEREAIALRYGADLTVPEIARVLGEERTTIEGRVYGGLRKLRATLGDG